MAAIPSTFVDQCKFKFLQGACKVADIDPFQRIFRFIGNPLPDQVFNVVRPQYDFCIGIFPDRIDVRSGIERFKLNDVELFVLKDLNEFFPERRQR